MGRFVFKLPDLGEGTAEAEIVAWHVKVGDLVAEDAPLVDMLTDKATVEMTSPVAGKLIEVGGAPGEMAAVGGPIACSRSRARHAAGHGLWPAWPRPVRLRAEPWEAAPGHLRPPAMAEPAAAAASPGARVKTSGPSAPPPGGGPGVRPRGRDGPAGRIGHEDPTLHRRRQRRGRGFHPRQRTAVEEVKVMACAAPSRGRCRSPRRILHFAYVEENRHDGAEDLAGPPERHQAPPAEAHHAGS